jgi:hypothetical protein
MKCFIRAGLVAATLAFGCSDERDPLPSLPDAGAPTDAARADAGADADASIDAAGDGFFDLFDVISLPDAGCAGCVRDRCGAQINACFNNPACGAGLLCTLQMCAGGLLGDAGLSTSSLVCVLGCFNGDQALAFMAIGSITCLTMTCGSACGLAADAAVDVRPPLDAPAQTDVSADVSSPDVNADAEPPEAGPGVDATDDHVDSAAPDDAADDGSAESGTPIDGSNDTADEDVTPDDATSDNGVPDNAAQDTTSDGEPGAD